MHPELVDESYEDFAAPEVGPQGEGPWEITMDDQALWAGRKIAAAEAILQRRLGVMAREIARLERWVEDAKRHAQHTRAFFEGKLQGYYERLDEAGKLAGKKTYRLPNLTLKKRPVPTKWAIDQERLLAWARPKGLVRVKEEADWATIKAVLDLSAERAGERAIVRLTGEVLDFICVEVPPHQVFSVDVQADEAA
jgi:hypothetical protein